MNTSSLQPQTTYKAPNRCHREVKSGTVQQMKEWLCESSEYLFLFIPPQALVCIIGSYGPENGIPREITLGAVTLQEILQVI